MSPSKTNCSIGSRDASAGVFIVLNSLRSGGAEKQLLWIASAIAAMGIPCTVFEVTSGERTMRINSMIQAAELEGVKFVPAPSNRGNLYAAWRLHRHLADQKPSLVWSWGLRADSLVLLTRAGGHACKWLVSLRCSNEPRGLLAIYLQRIVAKLSHGVVSNTHAGLKILGENCVSNSLYRVLPNMINLESDANFSLPQKAPEHLVIVMLGNIKIHHKGYDIAVQVASKLLEKKINFELRIAGRPDEYEILDASIRAASVNSVIKFYGEISNPEDYLRDGHLYLLLSRFEGMPNTLLEALSCGLPAIATDVGDLRELKDTGAPYCLIPTANAEAAVKAVEQAVANWAETRELGPRGQIWVRNNFSEAACRAKLRSILLEVLEQ